MKKDMKRILSGAAGAAMLASGAVQTAAAENGCDVTVNETGAEYSKVANVQGTFSFDQDVLTPPDEVFNLFGTAVTGVCAKPDFIFGTQKADYYINVGGKITKAYTVDLRELPSKTSTMLCSCATAAATVNAKITGVRLADVLELAEMSEDVNTVAVRGSDGYDTKLPLQYALDHDAMLVYKVGDADLPSGTQLWVPRTVAKYFTRDVVDVELLAEKETPEIEQRADELRAEVAIMNYADDAAFHVGEEITFEGYADDCGDPIAAVDFSLDGGETWTTYETAGATAERWVYWNFSYAPQEAGTYQLSVRARTESGRVSKMAANLVFEVAQAEL